MRERGETTWSPVLGGTRRHTATVNPRTERRGHVLGVWWARGVHLTINLIGDVRGGNLRSRKNSLLYILV